MQRIFTGNTTRRGCQIECYEEIQKKEKDIQWMESLFHCADIFSMLPSSVDDANFNINKLFKICGY